MVDKEELDHWRLLHDHLASCVARDTNKDVWYSDIMQMLAAGNDIEASVDLIPVFSQVDTMYDGIATSRYGTLASQVYNYAVDRFIEKTDQDYQDSFSVFDNFLQNNGLKISRLVASICPGFFSVNEDNVYPEGFWFFETPILDQNPAAETYHFELEVSETEDFAVKTVSVDSAASKLNWTYEYESGDVTTPIPTAGVSSAYIGRRVRYSSKADQYLLSGEEYWFRLRQKVGTTKYAWVTQQKVIWT